MRLEQTPRQKQTVRVNLRLITASSILQLAGEELEQMLSQERMENPALDVAVQRVCLYCGLTMYGERCTNCGGFSPQESGESRTSSDESNGELDLRFDLPINYSVHDSEDEEGDNDPLAGIPKGETLSEILLQQLESLVSPDDAPIAEQLVGNLNERGYLEISLREVAQQLDVPLERVEYVLMQLQTLEPLGIGARDLRECLLIQYQVLSELEKPHRLVYPIIDGYLPLLGKGAFGEISLALGASEEEVREAGRSIRDTLHPFPTLVYEEDLRYTRNGNEATYVRPDILIRRQDGGFEIELIEEKRYLFKISGLYEYRPASGSISHELEHYLRSHSDRARLFIESVQRRWQTLKRVAELIVNYQQEFLEKGVRYLRPLTRSEVASRLNLDEGTVSRATANKYALLPNGRLLALADFFDGSLRIKELLRDLISEEDTRRRYSDDELARLLTAQGISMARRTVTKYREELGIASSRER